MRISDWSSDVCSSDLQPVALADLRKQACIAAIAFDVRIVAEAAGVEPETRTEAEAVAPQVNRCHGLHIDRVQASGPGTRSAVGLMPDSALAAERHAPPKVHRRIEIGRLDARRVGSAWVMQ